MILLQQDHDGITSHFIGWRGLLPAPAAAADALSRCDKEARRLHFPFKNLSAELVLLAHM